jgi:putative transposase
VPVSFLPIRRVTKPKKETSVNQDTDFDHLLQSDPDELRERLEQDMRANARRLLLTIYADEVTRICGPRYHPAAKEVGFRSGHTPVQVPILGQWDPVLRPRVRRRAAGGGSTEIQLRSHQVLKKDPEMVADLVRLAQCGVSNRAIKRAVKGRMGSSKSLASKVWIKASLKMLAEFRERRFADKDWLALMLDGIRISQDQHAVVALGITAAGEKVILDFEIGASENGAVTDALIKRLKEKGFGPINGYRLLAVTDGSDPLRAGVRKAWPDAVIQRCLVHKESNLRGYLPKKNWGELAGFMARLRKAEGANAGEVALRDMEKWLSDKNAAARASLAETGEELLAVHRLGVPATLHSSLLSTNLIENPFRNVRRQIGRVTRFRPDTDQAERWLAFGLHEAERGFRRLRNADDLVKLRAALRIPKEGGIQMSSEPTECSHGPL